MSRLDSVLFLLRIFPFWINFRFELAAADQFLQIADDGAAGDFELAAQGGHCAAFCCRPFFSIEA